MTALRTFWRCSVLWALLFPSHGPLAALGSTTGPATSGWAFQPIRVYTPPTSQGQAQATNLIDAFVLAKLKAKGLSASPAASRTALLRRVCFDLTGLPPSSVEVEEFTREKSPDAYPKLIDRLLESSQYGERWARHWLDLARYADTGGFEKDLPYREAWKYRDYVIRALNANKPLDRFIEEQVAGDELWPDDPEAVAATGLYAVGPASQDSAIMTGQLEYEWLTDAADTTGAMFLGLTFGCARCHNHKYDPITQQDYFAMQAIFAASDRPYPAAIREHSLKGLNGILADIPIPKELLNDPRCTIRTDQTNGAELFHRVAPMEIRRLQRGELSKPKEVAVPALPGVFGADKNRFDPAGVPPNQRRAVLAKWLVSPENPLTARVLVNRVWAWHFGQGLVRTPNDFGAQGEAPTHPELLDWLARDFVDHGWDLKRLHKLILSSATYQESSRVTVRALEMDPENRWLSHFNRRRLDGDEIWDNLHSCAGTLNLKPFGPPVVPALTKDELSGLFAEGGWKATKDTTEYDRRAVYLFERRTFLIPVLDAFDPPDMMASCAGRFETTVPTQALALLNSKVARRQAVEFARRLLKECADAPETIPNRAWLLAFNRPITAAEEERAMSFLRKLQTPPEELSATPASVAPGEAALVQLCLALFNANEFVFVD